jgi:hypothetical protein
VREAMSRVAGKVIGATVEGLISGTQGAADGIRSGWRRGSQSIAGRPGMAWAKGLVGGIRRTPKGYATDGALVVNRHGGLGDQRRCGSPKPVLVASQ